MSASPIRVFVDSNVLIEVTAIKAHPDWLVTSNTEHFDEQVALRTGLRIATPRQFLERCGVRP